ncbi:MULTISPECIES: FKBP-type peptidyl-prolyl cis-trans isomerase [Bifidobacterium]|uniref:FKBP-type peptidyl-prolyl cis-trans isomerase n=1 Tax=Bifidobacterium TaxID=1678 RepID=UPI001BDBEFC2|nr:MULTISPECIES: FKBP-type peptidyl-prolyl cis-trans isomerase [Bifidobacterium]MBT1161434.1 FKBP-type peptidyl-prolyl cis-trans isomerase [Bifidobacterium sp. SO1]MBW3079000.1 FKBP-type peptidyl-prolyl cis-trans isomerase [Bifidobacterium simiiventris]
MLNKTISQYLRTALAGACAFGLCLTLAACGGSSNSNDTNAGKSTDSSSKSTDSSSSSDDKSALKKLNQLSGITATGELGKKPTIALAKTPMTVEDGAYAILQKGDGKAVEAGDRVCVQGIAINAKDGSELMDTWTKNTPDCSWDLTSSQLNEAYKELFIGQQINGTVAIGVNDSNSSGTSYIMALTIVSSAPDPTKATGEEVKDVPSDLPKVTRAKDGKPSIDMNGYKGSDKLVVQPLIKGTGAKVEESGSVKVQYTGWLLNGKQFDSSWDKGAAVDFALSNVIKGWTQGLAGQTVGSQVLLVVPPDLGYGSSATGSIPANSTLVFVVDILATY